MILSYDWLKELSGTTLSPGELGTKLTRVGLNIEEIAPAAAGDSALSAEVTTNRPDWLCHLGVAREIAAMAGGSVREPGAAPEEKGPATSELTSVTVHDGAREHCPRYTARVIRGVAVRPSPEWLRNRLLAIGQRPINNIVDITNLVCFEMNQPLHAFDMRKLAGGRITVRMAREGEAFAAITGEKCVLGPSLLVIADDARAVAVAGVKGGENTEVDGTTVDVLLESAYFQPKSVRRSARHTRMSSESSYRYERGIDPGMTARASARAAALILELAGGELAKGVIDTNPGLGAPWETSMRFARCAKVLGFSVPNGEVERILVGLGLRTVSRDAEKIVFSVPSFRQDLKREIDLVEEVARVAGYDLIPEKITMPLELCHTRPAVAAKRTIRETMAGLGYNECSTDAFVPESWCRAFAPDSPAYRVRNPVNAERPMMRTSLVPSLLEVRRVNRLEEDVRLFEIAHAYGKTASGPSEPEMIAVLDDRGAEYVRGAVEAFAAEMGVAGRARVVPGDLPGIAPGTGGVLEIDGSPVARIGLASKGEAARFDLDFSPAVGEIDLAALLRAKRRSRSYEALPRFPGVARDISISVEEKVSWAELSAVAEGAASLLDGIEFLSLYRGKGVRDGFKAMAFSMRLRAPGRSLTDEEANAVRDKVAGAVLAAFPGAELR